MRNLHLRSALARRDPITGLCDAPEVVAFYRLIVNTPALASALPRYQTRSEEALAAALRTPRQQTIPSPSGSLD